MISLLPSPRPAVHFWGDYSAHSFAWFEGMSHGVVSQSQLRLQFHARKTATPRQFLREISIACCSRRLEEANLDFVSIKDFYVFAQPISMCLRRRVMRRHHKEKGAKGALSLRRDETGIFFLVPNSRVSTNSFPSGAHENLSSKFNYLLFADGVSLVLAANQKS